MNIFFTELQRYIKFFNYTQTDKNFFVSVSFFVIVYQGQRIKIMLNYFIIH